MDKYSLLKREFKKKESTTNEAIERIYRRDLSKGKDFMLNRGWRFYVHLNKETAKLAADGVIEHIGYKVGKTKKIEKVWRFIK